MRRRLVFGKRVLGFAAVAILVCSSTAQAQSTGTYRDSTGSWRYYYGRWYHYPSYVHGSNAGYYARPDRVLPHGSSPAHYGAYLVYRSPPQITYAPPAVAPSATAKIEVRVPADAELWFDDKPATATGAVRQFVSPALSYGPEFVYTIRARWKDGGKEQSESRRLLFRAGDQLIVTFPSTAPTP